MLKIYQSERKEKEKGKGITEMLFLYILVTSHLLISR